MSGMEFMINAVIKSLGIDADDLKMRASEIHGFVMALSQDVRAVRDDIARMEGKIDAMHGALRGDAQLTDDSLLGEYAAGAIAQLENINGDSR